MFLNNQDYDPYGVPFQTSTLSLGYTGELTDPNGLVYLRARAYAPRLVVFLTRDPVEGVMERVASRNGYGYVEGNPITRTDPSGEYWWEDFTPALNASTPNEWIGRAIQFARGSLTPPTDRFTHAEYPVNTDERGHGRVDVLEVYDGERYIDMYEIKSYAQRKNSMSNIRNQLEQRHENVQRGKARRAYNSTNTPHPILQFEYDWNDYEWLDGPQFGKTLLGTVSGGPGAWYYDCQREGLIVYWYEAEVDENARRSWSREIAVPLVVSDSMKTGNTRPPSNSADPLTVYNDSGGILYVIDYTSWTGRREQDKAAFSGFIGICDPFGVPAGFRIAIPQIIPRIPMPAFP